MTRTDGLGTLLYVDGLVSVKELAARWGVTRDTARQGAVDAGFPEVIHFRPRLLRWLSTETHQHLQRERSES